MHTHTQHKHTHTHTTHTHAHTHINIFKYPITGKHGSIDEKLYLTATQASAMKFADVIGAGAIQNQLPKLDPI